MHTASERYHVIAASAHSLQPAQLRDIAAALGISAYDARLRISATLPRSLAVFDTPERALRAATTIAALALPTAAFPESHMPPVPPLTVRRWKWEAEDLLAIDRQGTAAVLPSPEVAYLVLGRRVMVRSETNLEAHYEVGTRGTVDTHYSVAKEKKKTLPPFALLLPRDIGRPAVLFDALAIDRECMPIRTAQSHEANMLHLLDQLVKQYPEAQTDRTLLEHRVEPEHYRYYNRRTISDPTIAVAYALSYLTRATATPEGVFNACMENAE